MLGYPVVGRALTWVLSWDTLGFYCCARRCRHAMRKYLLTFSCSSATTLPQQTCSPSPCYLSDTNNRWQFQTECSTPYWQTRTSERPCRLVIRRISFGSGVLRRPGCHGRWFLIPGWFHWWTCILTPCSRKLKRQERNRCVWGFRSHKVHKFVNPSLVES